MSISDYKIDRNYDFSHSISASPPQREKKKKKFTFVIFSFIAIFSL